MKKGTILTVSAIIQRQDCYPFGKTRALVTGGNNCYFYYAKKTDKEKSTDVPSWARGEKPKSGENDKKFAKRLIDEKYGVGNWKDTGPGSEYSQIKKCGDRNIN